MGSKCGMASHTILKMSKNSVFWISYDRISLYDSPIVLWVNHKLKIESESESELLGIIFLYLRKTLVKHKSFCNFFFIVNE